MVPPIVLLKKAVEDRMDAKYRPGDVSATLFGKKKQTDKSKSFLADLFSSPKGSISSPGAESDHVRNQSLHKSVSKINSSQKSQNHSITKTEKSVRSSPIVKGEKRKKKVTEDQEMETPPKKMKSDESKVSVKSLKTPRRKDKSDKQTPQKETGGQNEFPILHETLTRSRSGEDFDRKNLVSSEEWAFKPYGVTGTWVQQGLPKSKRKPKKRETAANDEKEEEEATFKRIRKHRHRDKTDDERTIFIGNCSLSTDKKTLKNLFITFGAIDSIRFRCAPAAQLELPRRAVVITKNFHEQSNSFAAFIVFKEEEAAKKALSMNGHLLNGLHLRVDLASQSKKHDKKKSIFLGNLPFDVKEEHLRAHFADCGDIVNVRVIRDRRTSLGKGIAYIQFESKDSVTLALKLDASDFKGRPLRVRVCTNNPEKIEERKAKKESKSSRSSSAEKGKKISFAPSNLPSSSFATVLKIKQEKRLRKHKKKRENAKKTDSLSTIFGDVEQKKKKSKVKKNKQETKGRKKKEGSKGAGRKNPRKDSKKSSFRTNKRKT